MSTGGFSFGRAQLAAFFAVLVTLVGGAWLLFGGKEATQPNAAVSADTAEVRALKRGTPVLAASEDARDSQKDPLAGKKYVPREVVVRFKEGASKSEKTAARRSVRGKLKQKLSLPGAELLTIPAGASVPKAARTLEAQPGVKYGGVNNVVRTSVIPNDSRFDEQWALKNDGQGGGVEDADIDATDAWEVTTGSEDVVVAVVDTGVDYLHPDLANNIWVNDGETGLDENGVDKRFNNVDDDNNQKEDDWRGWNFIDNPGAYPDQSDPMDDDGHGTHVAGTIGAEGNNGLGVTGVAWNTKIMPIKVLGANGGDIATVADGMAYAAANGAKIVSASLGYEWTEQNSYEREIIASYPDTLFVFAAGNSSRDNDGNIRAYPCSDPASNVVCVASTDPDDNLSDFSNFGVNNVDIAAPGRAILSTKASVVTQPTGDYWALNGTSMATPQVSGTAALLLSEYPTASALQLRDALVNGADVMDGLESAVGSSGRLNAFKSLAVLDTEIARPQGGTSVALDATGELRVKTAANQADQVDISASSNTITVDFGTTGGEVVPGSNCYVVNDDVAHCRGVRARRINVSTYDQADAIANHTALPMTVDAGSGDDGIVGGWGDDTLLTGDGADTYQGRGGTDVISYSGRTVPINVNIDSTGGDGAAGEGDFVSSDIEHVIGGSANDILVVTNGAAKLEGRDGDDTLIGGPGDDNLIGADGADLLDGQGGDDQLSLEVGDEPDVSNGGTGSDTLAVDAVSEQAYNGTRITLDGLANDGERYGVAADNAGADLENILGADGPDWLEGNAANNSISGGYDSDKIIGGLGADVLRGDAGAYDEVSYADRVEDLNISLDAEPNDGAAGEGDNVNWDIELIRSGSGDDTLDGGPADFPEDSKIRVTDGHMIAHDEMFDGGAGSDVIRGGPGWDAVLYDSADSGVNVSLDGSPNDGRASEADNVHSDIEAVVGSNYDDVITGTENSDVIDGGYGDDVIDGRGGDDTIAPGNGNNTVSGGTGVDWLTYDGTWATFFGSSTTAVNMSLAAGVSVTRGSDADSVAADFEKFEGSNKADTITGSEEADQIDGGAGNDAIHGAGGDDRLYGGGGEDQIHGDAGDDWIRGDDYDCVAFDLFELQIAFCGSFNAKDDQLFGGSGDDYLNGIYGSNDLSGGDGDDTLNGTGEADVLSGGDGIDVASYESHFWDLKLSLDGLANDGGDGENDLIATDVEGATGGPGDDEITGDGGPNALRGGLGKDKIDAGAGDDTLIGDGGADTLSAEDGSDYVDAIDGSTGDLVNCGAGVDTSVRDTAESATACESSSETVPSVGAGFGSTVIAGWGDAAIEYESRDGVSDNVEVSHSDGVFIFTAVGHDLMARPGCDRIAFGTITCKAPNDDDTSVKLVLLDQSDQVSIDSGVLATTSTSAGPGNDTISGGGGADSIDGGLGSDAISGGAGMRDSADYGTRTEDITASPNGTPSSGAVGEQDTIGFDVENIRGGAGDDVLTGNQFDNVLSGFQGNDLLDGRGGRDTMAGGDQKDTVTYADRTAPVSIHPSPSAPGEYLGETNRELSRSGEAGENDWVYWDVETLIGGAGDDSLRCARQLMYIGNTMIGGPGADTVEGCEIVDRAGEPDVVSYFDRTEPVVASLDGAANDGAANEGDRIGPGVEGLVGGSGNDQLYGDSARNALAGGAGDDYISARDTGRDTLACGDGMDSINIDHLDETTGCEATSSTAMVELRGDGEIAYTASAGVPNSVSITEFGGYVTFSDLSSAVTAGFGCETLGNQSARCVKPPDAELMVTLRGENDVVHNQTAVPATFDLGDGNDTVIGGGGADKIVGGSGTDTVNYDSRTTPLTLRPDGLPNDGDVGEGDNIGFDVENIIGGSGNDTIYGTESQNSLSGGAGEDTISSVDTGVDTVDCGDDVDSVHADGFDELISCENRTVEPATLVSLENGTVTVVSSVGGESDLNLSGWESSVNVLDTGTVRVGAGEGCARHANGSVSCQGTIDSIDVDVNDGNDEIRSTVAVSVPTNYELGAGDDVVDGSVGADTVSGGSGNDTVTYQWRQAPLDITLDGATPSGQQGEGDILGDDIEKVIGGYYSDRVEGNGLANELIGNNGANVLIGKGGDDHLNGGSYGSRLVGGTGDDFLTNGAASYEDRDQPVNVTLGDEPTTGNGYPGESDTLDSLTIGLVIGGSGDDAITILEDGSGGTVDGGAGDDILTGGPNQDNFSGGDGNDTLLGGDEPDGSYGDTLSGGAGDDTLTGGWGEDQLDGGSGADAINGGLDRDYVDLTSRSDDQTITLDNSPNDGSDGEGDNYHPSVEDFTLGDGDDSFTRGTSASTLYLVAGGGNDTITGGNGVDYLEGGDGNDTINGRLGGDYIWGGSGTDAVTYADRVNTVEVTIDNGKYDGEENEKDYVSPDIENVIGGEGDDKLTGNSQANTLDGGAGSDTLVGNAGADTFIGGDGDYDMVSYNPTSTVAVNLSIDNLANDGAGGEGDNIRLGVEGLESGNGADVLVGDNASNTLISNGGNDTITGNGGADWIGAGAGSDTVHMVDGTIDYGTCGADLDTLNRDADDQLVDCESPNDLPAVSVAKYDDTIVISGSAGGESQLTVSGGSAGIEVQDAGTVPVVAGYGCEQQEAIVTCEGTATYAFVNLGDGDDSLTSNLAASVSTSIDLGAGEDRFEGAGGSDAVSGGPGIDTVSYATRNSTVIAWLDGINSSGAAGENDLLQLDIENLIGGSGNDTLNGNDASNVLDGGSGNDTFDAGDGDDTVDATDTEIDDGTCGAGTDTLNGDPLDDVTDCELGTAAPDTTITAGPADGGYTKDSTPTLNAESTPAGASFDCRVDGGTWTACSASYTTAVLSDGSHTVDIRARNASGAADQTPASRTFTVDTVTPTGVIASPLGLVTTSTPQLVFSATDDNGVASTSCRIDSGAFAPCTSGVTLGALADGSHSVTIEVRDVADNNSFAFANFYVDTTPPDVSVSGSTLSIVTNAGQNTALGLSRSGNTFTATANVLKAGVGCSNTDHQTVTCTSAAVTNASVDLGDGDDNLNTSSTMNLPISVQGGSGNDWLTGGSGNDTIDGGTGADMFQGAGGADTVTYASRTNPVNVSVDGVGNDGEGGEIDNLQNDVEVVVGGSGNDTFNASFGNETFNGGSGTDLVTYESTSASNVNLTLTTAQNTGGGGTDTLSNFENLRGSQYQDILTGSAGANVITGLGGNDTINGQGGTDTVDYSSASSAVTVNLANGAVTGGAGNDALSNNENAIGSDFNDTINSAPGVNVLNGGAGIDTLSYSTGISSTVTVNLATTTAQSTGGGGSDTISNFENLTGGSGADNLTGTATDNVIAGLGGNDTINGSGGNDTTDYSAATSAVTVNLVANTASGGAGGDTLSAVENVNGGSANDTITPNSGSNVINGNGGTDTLTYAATNAASSGVTLLLSSTAAQATGGSGTETVSNVENLTGSSFNDVLGGSSGSNTLAGGSGTDTVTYQGATGGVTVTLSSTTGQNTGGAGTDAIATFENLTGSPFVDTLTGNTGANVITGGLGVDTLSPGSGNDTVLIRDGVNDSTNCGSGTDTVTADASPLDATVTGCETVSRP